MSRREEQLLGISPREDNSTPNVNPFINSPAEFLSKIISLELKKDVIFTKIFGDYIDAYPRDDYPVRALPALRIYDKGYRKEYDSWFINGNMYIDLILPSNLRRYENQEVADVLSAALLQQFRRPSFFTALCGKIPGLNELGKTFEVDKDLAFVWEKNQVPLTQIKANFRIDIREWDAFLESDDRTKDEPFKRTLGDLNTLAGIIQGMRETEVDAEVEFEQTIEQPLEE